MRHLWKEISTQCEIVTTGFRWGQVITDTCKLPFLPLAPNRYHTPTKAPLCTCVCVVNANMCLEHSLLNHVLSFIHLAQKPSAFTSIALSARRLLMSNITHYLITSTDISLSCSPRIYFVL